MISQVLILRELLVLAQGQELKLALGLWGWLLWVGLGSLAGGRLQAPGAPGAGPGRLGGLLALLGLLLPATILAGRALPSLAHLPLGQSLPLSTTFLLFLLLLAPFGLVSGYFFPGAVQVLSARQLPKGPPGGPIIWRPWARPWGWLLLQLFLVGRYANLSLGLAVGPRPGPGALAPGPAPVPGGPGRAHPESPGAGRGRPVRPPVGGGQPQLGVARAAGDRHRGQSLCPVVGAAGKRSKSAFMPITSGSSPIPIP